MNLLGNLICLIFGGFAAALGNLFGGMVLCITVVGIPWGLQCFKIAGLVLWPLGRQVTDIPCSELDNDNEEIGEEDEENNGYSPADTE